jgi:hypothetical protein
MMNNESSESASVDRLTVSLGRGQRKNLEEIADLNDMKLAQIVRCALSQFISENHGKRISLRFPKEIES